MKKKLLSTILTLCMIVMLLPISALAGSPVTVSANKWYVYANGNAIIIDKVSDTYPNLSNIYIDSNADGVHDAGDTPVALTDLTETNGGYDLSTTLVLGGSDSSDVASTRITMLGGNVRAIYGGGLLSAAGVTGNTNVTVSGGTVNSLCGGCYQGTVTGDTNITVSGGTVNSVYGGGSGSTSIVTGNTNITISGGTLAFVFGGALEGNVNKDANITVSGGTVRCTIYGGTGTTSYYVLGNSNITVSGGTVSSVSCTNVFGGNSINGSRDVTITGGTIQGNITNVSGTKGTDHTKPTNGTDNVYITTLTIGSVGDAQSVSSLTVTSGTTAYSYSTVGVLTDSQSKIYAYLPAGAVTTSAVVGGSTYNSIGGLITTIDGTAAGALYAAAPTVSSVSVPANGTYTTGQSLNFTVNFSKNVTVDTSAHTPYLSLTIGSTAVHAAYISGSSSSALLFSYTVASGDSDTDGITVGALSLNGGTIKDDSGNNATLTLNSLASTSGILVDAAAPTVSSVSVPANRTYTTGQSLNFTVNFSKNVTVDTSAHTPYLSLTIGSTAVHAAYISGSSSSALLFSYPVASGDSDTDGITVGALSLNGGAIKDDSGNNATLTLNSVASTSGVLVGAAPSVYVPSTSTVTTPSNDASVVVGGTSQTAGTSASSTNSDGQTVKTITLDTVKLNKIMENAASGATVTIPVTGGSAVAAGVLTGAMIKSMEAKDSTLEIKTDSASYTLPASEINIDAVSKQFGQAVSLSDIKVEVQIATPSNAMVSVTNDAASSGGYTLEVPALEYTINCTYGSRTIDVSSFNSYVERTIAIPTGVDPAKITTGVVVSSDGTVRHVPTKITSINGKYYAVINSLTNSTYTVIYNPVEFSDVTSHWAKSSINDMGSRMVISGVGGNNFEPDSDITRAEFAAIAVRALGLTPGVGDKTFKDVASSEWYCGYIQTAASYGLITGYSDGSFGPNDKITREQAITIIARAMKLTGLSVSLKDSDISTLLAGYMDGSSASDFARNSIVTCIKSGIVTGTTETTLSPKNFVTRAEVAVMVQRLLQKSDLI